MTFMRRNARRAALLGAGAALALLVSCTGFFPKPTLSTLAVGPATPTIFTGNTGNTVQMVAIGTFTDGSTSNPSVSWNSSQPSIAGISQTGLVTAVASGSTTITATSNDNPTITGSTTVTVTVPCIQSIAVTPTNPTTTLGNTVQFKAIAATCNGQIDITNVATWVSSDNTVATVSSTGLATTIGSGSTQITASSGNVDSPPQTLTVN